MSAPVSPSTGQYMTKSFWDAEVYDRWTDLASPWTAYTPTWGGTTTNPVLGNGSIAAAYKIADPVSKTVHLRLRLVTGSTTSFGSGFWTFTLPLAPTLPAVQIIHGFAGTGDGATRYVIAGQLNTSGQIERIAAAGSTGVTNTSPFTWGDAGRTGDQLVLGGTYQVT